jgi:hypothetical protein
MVELHEDHNNLTSSLKMTRKGGHAHRHSEANLLAFFLVGLDLRHQVLRPLLAYCTAPDDR